MDGNVHGKQKDGLRVNPAAGARTKRLEMQARSGKVGQPRQAGTREVRAGWLQVRCPGPDRGQVRKGTLS